MRSPPFKSIALLLPILLCACAPMPPAPLCPAPQVVDVSYLPAPGYFRQQLSQILEQGQDPTLAPPSLALPTPPIL